MAASQAGVLFLIVMLVGGVVAYWLARNRSETIIYPYQKAIWYHDGAFQKVVGEGRYVHFGKRDQYQVYDTRPLPLSVSGQEILTHDQVSIRVSLAGFYQLDDLHRAVTQSNHYPAALHTHAQTALRKAIGTVTLDTLLADKQQLDAHLSEVITPLAEGLGLKVSDITVLDVMLPANLKKAFSGVLEAQKEAQKNLEKARGEQAVLRSLANSAKLFDDHPALMQLRVIQSLATGNNSIVFGTDEKGPSIKVPPKPK